VLKFHWLVCRQFTNAFYVTKYDLQTKRAASIMILRDAFRAVANPNTFVRKQKNQEATENAR
jgi:hypothetical protein